MQRMETEETMKNLANVLAVLLLVAALGLIVGCGCGTATDRTEENMVETPNGTTTETPPVNETTMQEDMNTPQENENDTNNTNPIDGSVIENNNGTVGGAVEDAADGVGNAVGDVIDGVGNAAEDVMDGVGNAVDGNENNTNNTNNRNTTRN